MVCNGDMTRGGAPEADVLREPLGRGLIFGDAALGGEVALGEATLGGDVIFGGEYARGEPRVCGDLNPVGEASDGNGMDDRALTLTGGVPAICSASALKSRGTADGSNVDVDAA